MKKDIDKRPFCLMNSRICHMNEIVNIGECLNFYKNCNKTIYLLINKFYLFLQPHCYNDFN